MIRSRYIFLYIIISKQTIQQERVVPNNYGTALPHNFNAKTHYNTMAHPDQAAPSSSSTGGTATQRRTGAISSNSNISNAPAHGGAASSASTTAPSSSGGPLGLLHIISRLLKIMTILLRVALWPPMKIAFMAFPSKEYDGVNSTSAADRAARAFVAMFRSHISEVRPVITQHNQVDNNNAEREREHCPFVSRGYSSTISEIVGRAPRSPLLLVYLHSPLHRDGIKSIRDFLCQAGILQLLNGQSENVTCFGASVHSADGARLRDMLDVTSFPFMALLSVKSSGSSSNNADNNVSMELLMRVEGSAIFTIPPAQIKTYLTAAISRHAETIAEAEHRRIQREEEIRLREEQDREYQEALLADQIREIQQREAEEEERRADAEREELERLSVENENKRLEDAQSQIKEAGEPPAGAKDVARLRFTLPNGKKVDRRFRSQDTLMVVNAFLIVHFNEQNIEMKNIGLSTNFPRKSFKDEDMGLTLEEAGLAPQAVIMVQDLDA